MATFRPKKGFAGAFGQTMSGAPFSPEKQFEDGATIEEVASRSGLDFKIAETPSLFMVNGTLRATGQKTLYRDDNGAFISSMSQSFNVVQPMEILETHRQFLDAGGYNLRAAGAIRNGARFWSMAEGKGILELAGGDEVKSYLFMASAADGSCATYAIGTQMRAYCWNMAPAIIADAKNNGKFIRVTHTQVFDADEARVQIQSNDEVFKLWCEDARALSEERIKIDHALSYFADVFGIGDEGDDELDRISEANDNKRVQRCLELFAGAGQGSELESAKGTLWGAFNAVTEYVDHHAGCQSPENRFASATMGSGYRIKTAAWRHAVDMVKRAA